jgi:Trypsin-like peptidase domain
MKAAHGIRCLVIVLLFFMPLPGTSQELCAIERVKPILVMFQGMKSPGVPLFGAGFVVGRDRDDLLVATARHVVWTDSGKRVALIEAQVWWNQSAWLPVSFTDMEDASLDLAVLRIPGGGQFETGRRPEFDQLGDAHTVLRESDLYMLGFPIMKGWFSERIESSFYELSTTGVIRFKASNPLPGYSGGVLLDSRKRVIGMIRSDDHQSAEALSINQVMARLRLWGVKTELRPAPARRDPCDPAERQQALMEAQIQPQFRFVQKQVSAGADLFDSLEIWNDGGAISGYQLWQASYIEVSSPDFPAPSTRFIPAYYFRERTYRPDAQAGLLVTLQAWQNGAAGHPGTNETKEFARLEKEVWSRFQEKVMIRKRVFLEISYRDRANISHVLTYEVYPTISFGPATPTLREGLNLRMLLTHDLKDITADNLLMLATSSAALTDLGPGQDQL